MSKAVLVMDMPKVCIDCPLHYCDNCDFWCGSNGKELLCDDMEIYKPSWCPLKPLPQKQNLTFIDSGQDAIAMGWNACIEAIEGE